MKCKDIMKTDIECVSPETPAQAAAALMREENVGFLPVCEEGMRVVGTVTDRDIAVRLVAEGLPGSTSVEALMTRRIISCESNDDLDQARELMAMHHKSRILCLNRNGRLEGVISLSDLAQLDESTGIDTLRHVSSREARGDSAYIA